MLIITAFAISAVSLLISFYLLVRVLKLSKDKGSFSDLANPNSHASKMIRANVQAQRRR